MDISTTVIVLNQNTSINNSEFKNILEEANKITKNVFMISDKPVEPLPDCFFCASHHDTVELLNKICSDMQGDLLIISGTGFSKECFYEMHEVLHSAERHAAVSPRGTNMELLSLPRNEILRDGENSSQERSRQCYDAIKNKLPKYHLIPYPSSVCVLINGKLIRKFGFLKKNFSANIEDAIISWCLEINQYGYSSVAANHIYINNRVHKTVSLNAHIKSYPYLKKILKEYYTYFTPLYEKFVPVISPYYYKKPRLLLSLYNLIPVYNGTSEHTFGIAERLVKKFSDKYEIHVLITKENAVFFKANEKFDNIVYPDELSGVYHAGITFIQIYFTELLTLLNRHCLKIIPTVLDMISFRCDYFSVHTDAFVFKKSVEYSDGIMTISRFSKNDLTAAFPDIASMPPIRAIPIAAPDTADKSEQAAERVILPFDRYILVFGNTFKHKSMINVCRKLPSINKNFVVVGYELKKKYHNIKCYGSGGLSYEFINALYKNCSALIYPSEYEGFGLPVVQAAGLGKKVIISRTEVNKELEELHPEQKDNFIYFDTFDEIKKIIETYDLKITPPTDTPLRTYDEITEETEKFIEEILSQPVNHSRFVARNEILNMAEYQTMSIRNTLKKYVKIKMPLLFRILRKAKHIMRKVAG